MKIFTRRFLLWCFLYTILFSTNAQQYDPGPGNTLMLIGQTFQNEYNGYISGTGLTPAGSSHYATFYLGAIEQGDDNPNAQFLDHVRSTQNNPYALVALSFKDNTAAGGYGQMTDDSQPLNTNAVWDALIDVNSGVWNSQIDAFAQAMASRPDTRFLLRIGYEVSLLLFAYSGSSQYVVDWLNQQANAGINVFDNPDAIPQLDRQAYIDAYNYVANRIRNVNGVGNVDFIYHPVRGVNDTQWLYPGSQYVDWVAFSVFNNDVCLEVNGTFNCQGQSIDPQLQESINFAKQRGHSVMIAEAAVQAPASGSTTEFVNYLNKLHNVVVQNDIRALAYINSDWPVHGWGPEWGDSRVEVRSAVRNHWLGVFGSGSRYTHSGSSPGGPSCSDGVQNQGETGIDCGGPCPACGTPPSCSDGIQNGDETGIDCGGSCPDSCGPVDCQGSCPDSHPLFLCGACYESEQQAQSAGCNETCNDAQPSCTDGIQNGDETGVDCGGSCPDSCSPVDCQGNCPDSHPLFLCGACYESEQQAQSTGCNETCNHPQPTCTDGIQNQGETGVDCGGPCPTCSTPSCSDGIQNQGETGVDCGGPCQPCSSSGLTAKLLPPNDRILLSIGQDLKTQSDYQDGGVVQQGYPDMGGVVSYLAFYSLLDSNFPQYGALGEDPSGNKIDIDVDWGAGPLHSSNAADGFSSSSLTLALSMAEGSDPGDVWCAGCIAQIGNGQWDANIRRLAKFANDHSDKAIYLRIGFEFDGKWNLGYGNSTNFKNAWRRIVDVMRNEGVTNVAYVWQSSSSPIDDILEGRKENISDWYPGDSYVDWMGLSWFLLPSETAPVGGNISTQLELANEVVALARAKGKPVYIAESTPQGYDLTNLTNCHISPVWDGTAATGCHSRSASQIWSEWFVPFFDFIYSNSDVIRQVTYINVNWDDDTFKFGPGSGYAEGYWGRAGVHVNSTISGNWQTEMSKPIWIHGSSDLNAVLLGSSGGATARLQSDTSPINERSVPRQMPFYLYPNPAHDIIQIVGGKEGMEFLLYNSTGRKLKVVTGDSINIADLTPGLYFIRSGDHSLRFVKR